MSGWQAAERAPAAEVVLADPSPVVDETPLDVDRGAEVEQDVEPQDGVHDHLPPEQRVGDLFLLCRATTGFMGPNYQRAITAFLGGQSHIYKHL